MGTDLQTDDSEEMYEAPKVIREGTLLDITGGGTQSGPHHVNPHGPPR
jgi:hypothetical protein